MLLKPANSLLNRSFSPAIACVLVFAFCITIYLSNERTITVRDTYPNSLLALNWLFNHTFTFDALKEQYPNLEELPWYFVESINGHIVSTYPIGTAIVTFPFYFLIFIHFKLSSFIHEWTTGVSYLTPDLFSNAFNPTRNLYEKTAAAIATSLSAILFYLSVRLKFKESVALIVTFIFAFANSTWSINAQGLWQSTAANLLLVGILLTSLKLGSTQLKNQNVLLLVCGFFCGLLPGTRITSVLFSIAVGCYLFLHHRRQILYFFTGLTSIFFGLFWNIYFFGWSNWMGGYSKLFDEIKTSSYEFSLDQFIDGFLGLLISPNRGLFIFSPIMLLAIPGLYWVFRYRDRSFGDRLIGCLTLAALAIFIQYCFYVPWHASLTFGTRFITDILPIACFIISYPISYWAEQFTSKSIKLFNWKLITGLALITFSSFVQLVGVYSQNIRTWETVPVSYISRLWSWQDTEIQRNFNNIYYGILSPIKNQQAYLESLKGVINHIEDEEGNLVVSEIRVPAGSFLPLTAYLTNTGQSQWFGYQTGMMDGRTDIRVYFFDAQGNRVVPAHRPNRARDRLFTSGVTEPGEQAIAIGVIRVPKEAGIYQAVFELQVEGMGKFPQAGAPFTLNFVVVDEETAQD